MVKKMRLVCQERFKCIAEMV